jgi:hypothetical protein
MSPLGIRWNENWRGKPKYWEKSCPTASLSIRNPAWLELRSNSGCRGENPATSSPIYGRVVAYYLEKKTVKLLTAFQYISRKQRTSKFRASYRTEVNDETAIVSVISNSWGTILLNQLENNITPLGNIFIYYRQMSSAPSFLLTQIKISCAFGIFISLCFFMLDNYYFIYLFITSFFVIFSEVFSIRSYFVQSYRYIYIISIKIIILQTYSSVYLSSRHALT